MKKRVEEIVEWGSLFLGSLGGKRKQRRKGLASHSIWEREREELEEVWPLGGPKGEAREG